MLTCDDHPVLVLDLTMGRDGNWVAELQADADAAFSGQVTIDDGEGNQFLGTIYHSSLYVGRVYALVLGGQGKLGTTVIDAAHYQSATARLIAEAAISAAGETIDPNSDPLAITLDFWSRQQGNAQSALASLAAAVGVHWRVLANGKVWLGTDSSDEVVLPEVVELDRDGVRGTIELGLDALILRPGQVFNGERINRIKYCQTDDAPLRAIVWPEAA